jgi:hypothetical protein
LSASRAGDEAGGESHKNRRGLYAALSVAIIQTERGAGRPGKGLEEKYDLKETTSVDDELNALKEELGLNNKPQA